MTNSKKSSLLSDAKIVDLGDAKELTGGNSSGSKNDGTKTSSHYKDPRGGAGETGD